jgi:uncharacterized membrane protein YgaE (UPF0421/DUF939 family)
MPPILPSRRRRPAGGSDRAYAAAVPDPRAVLDAGRVRVRRRVLVSAVRVREGSWAVAQCAVAAGAAWALAGALLGHDRPFFASVAAIVCLGLRAAQRLRRVLELAVGVTLGVAVGEALVGVIGTGAWQIALVVAIALVLALALDGGVLVTAQAGLQAVFVVALPRVPGEEFARWQDAMIGGATALAVAALLPADPWRPAVRARRALLTDLSRAVRECADGVRRDDRAAAAYALGHMRSTQAGLTGWADAVRTGHEIIQLSPLRRRGARQVWERESGLASAVDRATRNLRVLLRRVLFAVGEGELLPDALPDLLEQLAQVLDLLHDDAADALPELTELAGRLDPQELGASGLSAAVVVAQLRSTVIDLLEGVGVDPARARSALPRG